MSFRHLLFVAITMIAHPALAGGRLTCSDIFGSGGVSIDLPRSRYVDLSAAEMPDELRNQIRMVRRRVFANLGWLPKLRGYVTEGYPAILMYVPGKKIESKNLIASRVYKINDGHLLLDHAQTKKKYRNNGLSLLALSELLARNPDIETIEVGDLQQDNYVNFEKNLERGGREFAVKQTIAYRTLAAFGFTEVTRMVAIPEKLMELNFPQGKYYMRVQGKTDGFTVRRPSQFNRRKPKAPPVITDPKQLPDSDSGW